jgi:hypothetical protein
MKTNCDSGVPVKSPFENDIIAMSSLTMTPGEKKLMRIAE